MTAIENSWSLALKENPACKKLITPLPLPYVSLHGCDLDLDSFDVKDARDAKKQQLKPLMKACDELRDNLEYSGVKINVSAVC